MPRDTIKIGLLGMGTVEAGRCLTALRRAAQGKQILIL